MIDGGILLMVLGAIGMGVVPIEQALAYRRWWRDVPVRAPVKDAFHIVNSDADLTALIEQLDD